MTRLLHTTTRFAFALALLALVAASSSTTGSLTGDWPQWRGPNRDGCSTEKGYQHQWSVEGPRKLWEVDTVGAGYSTVAIKDGRIVTQGDLNGVEHIICLSAHDGSTVWAVQPEPVAAALKAKIDAETKRLDRNSDGVIDEIEALNGLGADFNNFDSADDQVDAARLAADRVARVVKAFDQDGDGKLSFPEAGGKFRNIFGRIDQADPKADVIALAKSRADEAFRTMDRDADGQLTRKETGNSSLGDGFNRADQKDPATGKGDGILTRQEVEGYYATTEAGRDSLLTVAELTKFYHQNYRGKDGVLTPAELLAYLGGYRNNQGDGPRGTPTIDGKLVFAEGGNGDLTCLDLKTGKTLWHKNLVTDFGGGKPGWGYSESPLVVGEWVIVTPGGDKGTLAALNKYTGEPVWRSSNTERAHYSSPEFAEIGGVKQVVQFAGQSVFGVRLDDGKLLWNYAHAANGTANCATPIIRGDYVYATSAYGTGGGLAKISHQDGQFTAEEVYFDKALANHHGGVLLVGDYLYGFGSGGLICQNFLTGDIAWRARSVNKGSLVYADGLLFLLGENYEMALADASPDGYHEHGRFKIESHGRPSWAHPVVAGGRLYLRNQKSLAAYDVGTAK